MAIVATIKTTMPSTPQSDRQLTLALRPVARWGGRRDGAGRKRAAHPRVPHLLRGHVSRHEPCHVTLRMRRGLPSLRDGRVVREVQRSFAKAAEQRSFRVVHFSLQRDHVHLLVEANGPEALGRGMMSIGARIARAVHRAFGLRGPVLAERYHHRVLRTPREVRNALVYVLNNVRKHALARISSTAFDPASSGGWFDGWSRQVTPRVGPRPVAAASSWLLRVGWRRHGSIDPSETPAFSPPLGRSQPHERRDRSTSSAALPTTRSRPPSAARSH